MTEYEPADRYAMGRNGPESQGLKPDHLACMTCGATVCGPDAKQRHDDWHVQIDALLPPPPDPAPVA
jgi:hypothetical protein